MAYTTVNDPSAYFHTQLWTGNGTSQSITNDAHAGNFSPDWAWIKNRTSSGGAGPQIIWDTTRGVTKEFHMNTNEAEHTTTNGITSFDTDGFSLGNGGTVNENNSNFVGWQWIANGGTTSSNYNGSITSTVQANTTAGFSIVTYTGTGANATVGHGLSSAPAFIVTKNRPSGSYGWYVYHQSLGATKNLYIHSSDSEVTSSDRWNNTSPTSTVFSVGTNGGTNGSAAMLAYCFAEIQGYSSFGKYTGNGNEDGPFIYTGFAPEFIITKPSSTTGNWNINDTKRDPINRASQRLNPNLNNAEASDGALDFLSNGFKIRNTSSARNGSGNTIVYMAFARETLTGTNNIAATAK